MEYCNVFTKDALLAKQWQNETKGTSYTIDKQYLLIDYNGFEPLRCQYTQALLTNNNSKPTPKN